MLYLQKIVEQDRGTSVQAEVPHRWNRRHTPQHEGQEIRQRRVCRGEDGNNEYTQSRHAQGLHHTFHLDVDSKRDN